MCGDVFVLFFLGSLSFPLINMSFSMPVPPCIDYCSFIKLSEVWAGYASCFGLFTWDCFGNSGSFLVPHKFKYYLFQFCENVMGDFIGITSNLQIALGSSVQFISVAQSCPTLCNSMNCSTSGLPVHHQLPEFTQTHIYQVHDAIQISHCSFDLHFSNLESPLNCKKIQPVHSKGDRSWVFLGRNDAKGETPVLWPPHAKS